MQAAQIYPMTPRTETRQPRFNEFNPRETGHVDERGRGRGVDASRSSRISPLTIRFVRNVPRKNNGKIL